MIRIRIKCNHGLITAFSLLIAPAFIYQLSSQIIHGLCYCLFSLCSRVPSLKIEICLKLTNLLFWCHQKSNKILSISKILLPLFTPCAMLSFSTLLIQCLYFRLLDWTQISAFYWVWQSIQNFSSGMYIQNLYRSIMTRYFRNGKLYLHFNIP